MEALELREQWFKFSGGDCSYGDEYGRLWCFFCGDELEESDAPDDKHDKDCVWVKAKILLKSVKGDQWKQSV